jgi:hypothetical protein
MTCLSSYDEIMNGQISLELNYQLDEIISAQRMRFRNSIGIKVISILGIVGTLGLIGQQVHLWYDSGIRPETWFTPIYLPIIFIGVGGLVYFFAPQIDFRLNADWKHKLDLHLSENKLRVTVMGELEIFELEWHQIKRVLEDNKVYILIFGSEKSGFIILPKRVLGEYGNHFRDTLKEKSSPRWKVKG